ncbi:hypothetical protein DN390_25110 [Bacillus sp. SH7-1]|nr:hypothetical protein DN390_25110 [Bacillus sp. SH7-1]
MDESPIHIIKIKVVQVGGRHLRVSFFIFVMFVFLKLIDIGKYNLIRVDMYNCIFWLRVRYILLKLKWFKSAP